jgi:glycosyltransferase involved in cell wall biosynthesis
MWKDSRIESTVVDSGRQDVGVAASRPLNVLFLTTSMPIGGAERLLMDLVRTLDRQRCRPEIACLKDRGQLGEEISAEIPIHSQLIRHKRDVAVISRLRRLMVDRKIDALVTVGAGDKMFWGRLAARSLGLPVILSALHSTGWPDGIGRLNRMLTRITDGFIAVAPSHATFLVDHERFPPNKVFMIPNGIDTRRFAFCPSARERVRAELGIEKGVSVVGIVAALRPEKNHELFLRTAQVVVGQLPDSKFLIVGDGPERARLEGLSDSLGLRGKVSFLGSRGDVPEILSALDVHALTSLNEASPVSILEAMACGRPVVAPRVGSIAESLRNGETGLLVDGHTVESHADAWLRVLRNPTLAESMGRAGRAHVVEFGSLAVMTRGYEDLIWRVFRSKSRQPVKTQISLQ